MSRSQRAAALADRPTHTWTDPTGSTGVDDGSGCRPCHEWCVWRAQRCVFDRCGQLFDGGGPHTLARGLLRSLVGLAPVQGYGAMLLGGALAGGPFRKPAAGDVPPVARPEACPSYGYASPAGRGAPSTTCCACARTKLSD